MNTVSEKVVISQANLFGGDDRVVLTTTKPTQRVIKPKKSDIWFNRINLFSKSSERDFSNGHLDYKTGDGRDYSQLLASIESAIGLVPVIRKQRWKLDQHRNPLYRVDGVSNKFVGETSFDGSQTSFVNELRMMSLIQSAKTVVARQFLSNGEAHFIVVHAIDLLVLRLRKRLPKESPERIVGTFLEAACQHDFLDDLRSGETLRAEQKRYATRLRRAKRKVEKLKSLGITKTVEEILAEGDEQRQAKVDAEKQANKEVRLLEPEPTETEQLQDVYASDLSEDLSFDDSMFLVEEDEFEM